LNYHAIQPASATIIPADVFIISALLGYVYLPAYTLPLRFSEIPASESLYVYFPLM